MGADVKRQAITAVGSSAGAPAGLFGVLAGGEAGKEVATSLLGPAGTTLVKGLTPTPTDEEIEDKRKKRVRAEQIKLAQDSPGKSQTALTDATSQSAFPFRLY